MNNGSVRLSNLQLAILTRQLASKCLNVQYFGVIRFNNQLGQSAGIYHPLDDSITIDPKIQKQGMGVLVGVIKHELCHYYLQHFYPEAMPHGRAFKNLLKSIHGNLHAPESKFSDYKHFYLCSHCHNIYYRYRRINTHKYVCGNCHHKIHEISKARGLRIIHQKNPSLVNI